MSIEEKDYALNQFDKLEGERKLELQRALIELSAENPDYFAIWQIADEIIYRNGESRAVCLDSDDADTRERFDPDQLKKLNDYIIANQKNEMNELLSGKIDEVECFHALHNWTLDYAQKEVISAAYYRACLEEDFGKNEIPHRALFAV